MIDEDYRKVIHVVVDGIPLKVTVNTQQLGNPYVEDIFVEDPEYSIYPLMDDSAYAELCWVVTNTLKEDY